jgi:hypothetical protein
MRRFYGLATISIVLMAAPVWAEPTPVMPTLSAEQVERLGTGEVLVEVVNAELATGDAMGVINAPPERVMEVVADFENYEDFMPDITEAEIVGQEGDFRLCRGLTDTPWPMDDRNWTLRAWYGQRNIDGMDVWVSTWDYVPGSGNLEDTEGYWLLIPWGDNGQSTLVRYYITADLGTWLPDFLMTWATENMLPNMIQAIRDRLS